MKVIVFTNDSNIVSVMTPALDCGLSLEEIAEKDVPVLDGQSRPYLIIDDSELPDREYRDRWVIQGGKVIVSDEVEKL